MDFFNRIRKPNSLSVPKAIVNSLMIFMSGIILGIISKALDEIPVNLLPTFFEMIDLRNFFSRIGFWMFIGICIAVYAKTPLRAALNNILFFIGMVGSYYIYTITIAGFFPKSYMMLWVGMTIISPVLGMLCWYAKGTHIVSVCISAIIFMMMTRQAFNFGFWYFDISYVLETLLWVATIVILYRKPKQIACVIMAGIVLFFITSQLRIFGGWM